MVGAEVMTGFSRLSVVPLTSSKYKHIGIPMQETNIAKVSALSSLKNPKDLQSMDMPSLQELAQDIRERIISVVAKNGGHLAPSLGVVELTLALLHCFDADKDKFIWDVGHQSYAWKLLTGRADTFSTLRTLGGISGFPKVGESPYDHFGVGHASTSISAGLGMAMARDLAGEDHRIVTVIGDGALTGGQALEGLNLAGHMGKRFIVILNDNEMSISPNVGALSRFLSRNLSRRWVRQMRKDVLSFLRSVPRIGNNLATYAVRGEWSFKSFFTPGMLFEAFRFNYIGPVDGHDLAALNKHLHMASAVEEGPVLLHVLTRKGKGYAPAEEDPTHFHGVGGFDVLSGALPPKSKSISFTDAFSRCLVDIAKDNEDVVAITAAMPEGTGTDAFGACYPDRFVDVGICEQHAVTFAAGLAIQGKRPVVALYSTFLQRAYDQVVHDVCLQNLPVIFCIDRAGIVGEDGPTHHGIFDVAYLRHIPNLQFIAPRDEALLCHALYTASKNNGPMALRYPRGLGFGIPLPEMYTCLALGEGELMQTGQDALIIALGPCVHYALKAAADIGENLGKSVAVFDPIWIKPLPEKQILELVLEHKHIFLVEEASLMGGFSSAILELLVDKNALQGKHIHRIGIGDAFVEHGKQQELRARVGISAENIVEKIHEVLNCTS